MPGGKKMKENTSLSPCTWIALYWDERQFRPMKSDYFHNNEIFLNCSDWQRCCQRHTEVTNYAHQSKRHKKHQIIGKFQTFFKELVTTPDPDLSNLNSPFSWVFVSVLSLRALRPTREAPTHYFFVSKEKRKRYTPRRSIYFFSYWPQDVLNYKK